MTIISSPDVQSPEADTSVPPPPPILIYFNKSCLGGSFIDVEQLPQLVEDTSPIIVAKKLISELLETSHKPETILSRLGSLRGEEMVISHNGNAYTIKLPAIQKASDLENVITSLASSLGMCPRLCSKLENYYYCQNHF